MNTQCTSSEISETGAAKGQRGRTFRTGVVGNDVNRLLFIIYPHHGHGTKLMTTTSHVRIILVTVIRVSIHFVLVVLRKTTVEVGLQVQFHSRRMACANI